MGKCNTKEVPEFIMAGDEKTVSNFLSSLFEGGGMVGVYSKRDLSIQYDTTIGTLAKQVQILLLSFGIKSSLKCYINKCSHSKRFPKYKVVLYGDNIIEFANEIGFRSSIKKNKLQKCVEAQLSNRRGLYRRGSRGMRKSVDKRSRSQYMYDKVVSIKPIKTDIIHIEVGGDHTYIANGIVSHNSQESILKLRKAGIPNKETRFTSIYKFQIYKELENLVNTKRLAIPYDHVLYNEMIELQRKFTPTGFKVMPKKEGDGMKSDDVIDCLAGACYVAIEKQVSKLPAVKLVELGNPSGNSVTWRNMQGGVYGVGPGKRVAAKLEKRASWPMYKRR